MLLTHWLTVVEAVPAHVPLADGQLAVTAMVWQAPSRALSSRMLLLVPLARATRASSAEPPAAKLASDWPSMVHVKGQSVRPSTEAVYRSTPLQAGLPGGVMVTVVTATSSTTSSVAGGHGGLVTVSRSVAVPLPVNVTLEFRLLGSAIVAGPLTTDQAGVPLLALPARGKGVVDPVEHLA